MGGGSRKSYATLYIGGVAYCIYLTEGGWSFWPLKIEILRNMFMVPCWSFNTYVLDMSWTFGNKVNNIGDDNNIT